MSLDLLHFTPFAALAGGLLVGTSERVRAASANAFESELLGLAQGDPLLEVRRVAYSYHQLPVEVRISHVNTERYEYVVGMTSRDESA